MKRFIALALALMMVISFAACENAPSNQGSNTKPSGQQNTNTPGNSTATTPSGNSSSTTPSSGSQGGAQTVEGWKSDFNGTTLPGPKTGGKITEWTVKSDSVTIRIDGISYDEYIAYCKTLEALSGWKVYEGDYPEDVSHFPADYNARSKVYFTGIYGNLPRISVQYYSDKTCASNGKPHFCMFVYFEWN